MVRLIAQIAARFGLAVSEKFAAQAVPVVGAIGGAAINLAFAEHFQTLARGHFIIRRLERRARRRGRALRIPPPAQPSSDGAARIACKALNA